MQIFHGITAVSHEPYANSLRITALHSVTSLLLIPKIIDFQQNYPQITVQFSPSNLLTSFNQQEVDVGIRRGLGQYAGLESRKLTNDSIILVASPMLLQKKTIDADSLMKYALLEDTSNDIQQAILDFCKKYGLNRDQFKSSIKTTDAVPIVQNALAGLGMAFVSEVLVADFINDGKLVKILDYTFDSPETLYLVAPAHHFNWHKVHCFEKWIMQKLNSTKD